MDPRLAGRTARLLEPLHALGYFAPEVEAEVVGLGVRKGRATYFASRAAAMGRVGPGPVAATFYVFNPSLVAHFVPAVWEAASPEDVVAARYRGVSAAWTRLLGGETLGSDEVREAADLARTASDGCTVAGRPLHAAHADLPWPEEPHMVLFHALTLLREHRGDGHVAALIGSDLDGIEALVSHTATGKGFTRPAAQATRGWSDEQWGATVAALETRGLMTADGQLTEEGVALRKAVERRTEESAYAPWEHLGKAGTQRLTELCRPLVTTALTNGAFPAGVFA
ncbi:SCO6745 family protein [Nocardioides okcheonensis]|uniref:SCO6745 family protein n=1 Tax=Nocardioides okcheonensis TaxID=2894081 RepID=UPI001E57EFF0|nr:hypothetical protein [Nocardioides okcheonensis]UFN45446.1 hypothetical protein LN652_04345 [Nocardioides okcheonensis]